jgi:hypothetical protein
VWRGLSRAWLWVVRCGFASVFFVILLGKQLVVEHIFEYNGGMELGDPTATTRDQRSRLDEALDQFDSALTDLIGAVETGGLDHLSAEQKVAVCHAAEDFQRRRLDDEEGLNTRDRERKSALAVS